MDEVKEWVAQANDRLRSGRVGVTLQLQGKGNWLYLCGTFPPKPGENRRPYYTKIALKTRALTREIVTQAELTAKQVGLDLNLGNFDWRKFSDFYEEASATKTVRYWIEELESQWWMSRDRSDKSHQNTWKLAYDRCLKRLPQDAELTEELLLKWVTEHSQAGTSNRNQYTTAARQLALLAGIPIDKIARLRSRVSTKAVKPRDLPSDEEIVSARESLEDEGWRYLFGLQAAYGLRNHECFFIDFSEFPVIRVRDESKTGTRPVKPLYPEWAEEWNLGEPNYPKKMRLRETENLRILGQRITKGFERYNIPFVPYDLRHCWARRCFLLDIPPEVAAKLMGHSLQVHLNTYKAWIGERVYLDAVDRALQKRDQPPTTHS